MERAAIRAAVEEAAAEEEWQAAYAEAEGDEGPQDAPMDEDETPHADEKFEEF